MSDRPSVLLFSGGMDSAALRFLKKPDKLLYVDLGTEYSAWERSHLPADTIVLDLPALGQLETTGGILPGRNLILATIASNYGDVIYLGATKEDRVLDKTHEFCQRTTELLSYLWSPQWWTPGRQVSVETPLKNLTKVEILWRYLEAGGSIDKLAEESYSCYQPKDDKPCWTCKPCVRKWMAFQKFGMNLSPVAQVYCRDVMLPKILDGKGERPDEDALLLSLFHKESKS